MIRRLIILLLIVGCLFADAQLVKEAVFIPLEEGKLFSINRLNISTTTLLFMVPPYCGCGCKTKAIGDVFFSLLKYFVSNLPAGPGINISATLLPIHVIDNCSQKKNTFISCERHFANFFIISNLDYFSRVYI